MKITTSRSVRRLRRTVLTAALAVAVAPALAWGPAAAQAPGAGYRVVGRIPIPGECGWDYLTVDPAAHRLYVSHSTHVVVVDLASGSVVGDIPNTPGVHGIALAPALGRGFTSNGRDSTVTIFELASLKELGRVNVKARNPDAILYDPFSGRVFTMNGGSASATAVDAKTGAVVGSVDVGGRPEEVVSDGKGHIYINIESASEIAEVDARSLRLLRRWSIKPCDGPSGLAIDLARRRLFSVCDKVMAISDIAAGRVLTTVPIGDGPDGVVFDAARKEAFSSNGADGTMTVVRENGPHGYAVAQTVSTQRGARTVTLDPITHRLYTATAELTPPPAPTPERPRPRPGIVPGSFTVLVIERK